MSDYVEVSFLVADPYEEFYPLFSKQKGHFGAVSKFWCEYYKIPATCQLDRTDFEPDSKMCYECLKLHDLDYCFFEGKATARYPYGMTGRSEDPTSYHETRRLGSCLCA